MPSNSFKTASGVDAITNRGWRDTLKQSNHCWVKLSSNYSPRNVNSERKGIYTPPLAEVKSYGAWKGGLEEI